MLERVASPGSACAHSLNPHQRWAEARPGCNREVALLSLREPPFFTLCCLMLQHLHCLVLLILFTCLLAGSTRFPIYPTAFWASSGKEYNLAQQRLPCFNTDEKEHALWADTADLHAWKPGLCLGRISYRFRPRGGSENNSSVLSWNDLLQDYVELLNYSERQVFPVLSIRRTHDLPL